MSVNLQHSRLAPYTPSPTHNIVVPNEKRTREFSALFTISRHNYHAISDIAWASKMVRYNGDWIAVGPSMMTRPAK